jgi:hypothetical protein
MNSWAPALNSPRLTETRYNCGSHRSARTLLAVGRQREIVPTRVCRTQDDNVDDGRAVEGGDDREGVEMTRGEQLTPCYWSRKRSASLALSGCQ